MSEPIRPKGRRSRVKKVVITVIVLVAVLVGADFGLAAAAEYQVSKKMRSELSLTDDPSVDIHGFPFITQALAGTYSDISVNASHVRVQDKLRDVEVDTDLHNVHVGLSDLLSGHVQSVRIDEVDGRVQILAADVGRLLGINDLQIIPQSVTTVLGVVAASATHAGQPVPDGQRAGVELSGTVDIAGQQTKVSVFGLIELNNGSIVVSPKKLDVSNSLVSGPVAGIVEQQVLSRFNLTLSPSELPLPFTVRPTAVFVAPDALTVQGTATNIVLNSGSSF